MYDLSYFSVWNEIEAESLFFYSFPVMDIQLFQHIYWKDFPTIIWLLLHVYQISDD